MTVSEAPSHAELEAAIEQARIVNPLHSQPDYVDEHNAHLDTLTALLAYADVWGSHGLSGAADSLRATVTTALKRMGAL